MEKQSEIVKADLLELSQAALKAAAAVASGGGGGEESRCVDALSQLKSFPVTLEVLAATKIAKTLKSLKSSPSKKIQFLAGDVIASWKNKFVGKNKTTAIARNEDQERSCLTINGDDVSEIRKPIPQIGSIPKCNDSLRNKIREQVLKALCLVFNEVNGETRYQIVKKYDPVGVAVDLESALFAEWGSSSKGNSRSKYRSVLYNIKDPKNPDFRRKVLVGEIKAKCVGRMSPWEMASDERQLENEKIKDKALKKCIVGKDKEGTIGSDLFKCEKCGKKETTYTEKQTRSADEPMTAFITCMSCGHNWKE